MITVQSYRCLRSAGFQLVMVNVSIEGEILRCGLAMLPGNLNDLPIGLRDVDTDRLVCKIRIPEEYHGKSAVSWLSSPTDNLQFEVQPI